MEVDGRVEYVAQLGREQLVKEVQLAVLVGEPGIMCRVKVKALWAAVRSVSWR